MKSIQEIMAERQKTAEEHEAKVAEFKAQNPEPEPKKCSHGNIIQKPYIVTYSGEWKWEWQGEVCEICHSNALEATRKDQVDSILKIPKRYASTPLESRNFDMFNTKGGLVFSGSVGTGKTYEAITLAKHLYVKQGITGVFTTGTDMAMKLKSAVGDGTYEETVRNYRERDLLFIDDLGVESATEFMKESLYNILNHRYNNMLPVLFTTNLSAKEFADTYGQRLLSRLVEMAEFVKLNGEDKRLS